MTNSFMRFITTEKWKVCKTLFLSTAVLAMSSVTAYAKVEHCPDPVSIQFDNGTYQWQARQPGWVSSSQPRNVTNLGKIKLTSVKLKIDHKKGDVIECHYAADNGEKVLFTKGGLTNAASASTTRPEFLPIDEKSWVHQAAKGEFVCQPSVINSCGIDDALPLDQNDKVALAADVPQVALHFVPGTAFVAYACGKTDALGVTCTGPFHVNGTYFLAPHSNKFCVEVNRFAGLEWGQYYFDVSQEYAGEPMEWWGASVNPKYTLPKGITYVTYHQSSNYAGCNFLNF